jgi:Domain of unknown function (DUF4193)
MPNDIDEEVEEDFDEEPGEDEPLEDLEPTADDLAENVATPEPGLGDVESIQDLLAKQESQEEAAEEEEDETPAAAAAAAAVPAGDDRLEPAEARVIPMQATEFMCRNCFLVKHRSQLADKKKMFCRDCA